MPPVVIVRNETLSVPWELLWQTPVDHADQEPWKAFLGLKILFVSRAPRDGAGSVDDTGSDPRSGVLECDDVFASRAYDNDHPVLGHLFDDLLESFLNPSDPKWYDPHATRIAIETLEPPLDKDPALKVSEQRRIVDFVAGRHDVLHFDADAQYAATEASPSTTVRLRTDYKAHYRDVADWRLKGKINTLVVLNFCDSATSCWDQDSIARRMQVNGGRTVVGTSSTICDAFTGRFMTEFYRRLLDGVPVGLALHATRTDILDATSNPSALYYALHGAAGLVLSQADDQA